MRWHPLLLLPLVVLPAFVGAQAAATSAPRPETSEETCTVSGTVVRSLDGTPLKDATLSMSTDENYQGRIATTTSADGHFELRNIPAGHYRLLAQRDGYVAMQYGQKRSGDPGSTLTLRPGQKLEDLVFKLGKTGVIAGRVFDEDGEPMLGVRVRALRELFADGKIHFEPDDGHESNDLGEFRLYGLKPGRYLVVAAPERWNHIVGSRAYSADKPLGERAYANIYYPGVVSSGKASVITIKSGDEISSIDMLLKKVAVYRIRGRVVNLPPRVKGGGLFQVAALRRGEDDEYFSGPSSVNTADGTFEIAEVPSGNYTVRFLSRFEDGSFHSTLQDVNVTNADVEGVTLTAGNGVNILGRVIWDGAPKLERQALTINANSMEGLPFPVRGDVDDNNQFVLKDVPEGEYRLDPWGFSKDCYVKELRYNEQIVPDGKIRVAKESAGRLEITLSSHGAHIQGAVVNEDSLPAAGAWVVAIPEQNTTRTSYSTNTDQYGHFDIPGLPPGKYQLFSWAGLERGIWEDPEFLKGYVAKATSIEFEESDKKTTQLSLIPLRAEDGGSE
jgi:Carboxypeptidase regulatory-like domain